MATEQSMKRRKVNLARLAEPFNLTLTKKPANRSGFKVVRSDETEETEMLDLGKMPTRKRRRAGMEPPRKANLTSPRKVALSQHDLARTKRKDTGLLNLILPSGATKDDAMDVIEHFGLSDDYEIVQNNDGRIILHRREAGDVEKTIPIQLNNGIIAEVDAALLDPMANRKRGDTDEMGEGCALTRIDFDGRKFDSAGVSKWLNHFGVDYLENGVESVDGGVIVQRNDEIEEKDCHKIRLAEGIVGYVARADMNDVPVKITRAIVNEAFGNFGFGHLDFASALADPEFSNRSETAIFQLSDVLHNIVFRSGLPIGERKELVGRATAQFSTFMGNLMDNLPSVVLENMKAERGEERQRGAGKGTPGPGGDGPGPGGGMMPLTATADGMNSSFDDSWREGASAAPSAESSGDVYATITGGNTLEREDGKAGVNAGLALTLPAERTADASVGGKSVSRTGAAPGEETPPAPADEPKGEGEGAGGDKQEQPHAAPKSAQAGDEIGDLVKRAVLAAIQPLGDAVGNQQKHFDEILNDIQAKLVKSGETMRRLSRSVKDVEQTVDQIGGESVVRSDGDDEEYADDTGMNGSEDDGALFSGALGRNFSGTRQ